MNFKLPNLTKANSPWTNKRVLAYYLSFQEIESFSRDSKMLKHGELDRNERLDLSEELFKAGMAGA
jgi:hypothetical protein